MAAYGLYTHIQSNKRRSAALLIGLFILVYVMVFAGALLAEALSSHYAYNANGYGPSLDYLLRAAEFDFIKALPYATAGAVIWIAIASLGRWIAYYEPPRAKNQSAQVAALPQ